MPLLGNILTLFSDKKKTKPVFPVTKVKAVSNDEGVGLDAILENMVYTGVNNGEEATAPLNADTLGGRPAEDFATQNYVATEIARAQLDGGDVDLSGFATKDELGALDAEDVGAAPADAYERLNRKTKIPTNSDLNTYTTPGSYAIVMASEGATVANVPYASASGTLIVTSMRSTDEDGFRGGVWQKFYGYDKNTYERCTTDGTTWSGWIRAVKASGDTYTGALYRRGIAGAMGLAIGTEAMPECISIISVGDGTEYNRFCFRQYGKNGKRENYNLPTTVEPAQNINYEIVTSRTAKVLWTNASVDSAFAAQTITVNGLSNCSCVAVIMGQVTGSTNATMTYIAHKGVSVTCSTNINGIRYDQTNQRTYHVERYMRVKFSNNQIEFLYGMQDGAQNNERAVPLAVIGLW